MSIVVGDKQFRTLNDHLYVDGKRVLKAYANGVQVYPARSRGHMIKVRGTISRTYTHSTSNLWRILPRYSINSIYSPGLIGDPGWYNDSIWFSELNNGYYHDSVNLNPPSYSVKASFAAIYYTPNDSDIIFDSDKIINVDSIDGSINGASLPTFMRTIIGDEYNGNKRWDASQYIDPSAPGTYQLYTQYTIGILRVPNKGNPNYGSPNVYFTSKGHTINDHYFITLRYSIDDDLLIFPYNFVFPLCDAQYTSSLWFEDLIINQNSNLCTLDSYRHGNQIIFKYEISPLPVNYGRCSVQKPKINHNYQTASRLMPLSNTFIGTPNFSNNKIFTDKSGCFSISYDAENSTIIDRSKLVCAIPTGVGSLRLYMKEDPVPLSMDYRQKYASSIESKLLNINQTYAFADIPITEIMYIGNELEAPDWAKTVTEDDLIPY